MSQFTVDQNFRQQVRLTTTVIFLLSGALMGLLVVADRINGPVLDSSAGGAATLSILAGLASLASWRKGRRSNSART